MGCAKLDLTGVCEAKCLPDCPPHLLRRCCMAPQAEHISPYTCAWLDEAKGGHHIPRVLPSPSSLSNKGRGGSPPSQPTHTPGASLNPHQSTKHNRASQQHHLAYQPLVSEQQTQVCVCVCVSREVCVRASQACVYMCVCVSVCLRLNFLRSELARAFLFMPSLWLTCPSRVARHMPCSQSQAQLGSFGHTWYCLSHVHHFERPCSRTCLCPPCVYLLLLLLLLQAWITRKTGPSSLLACVLACACAHLCACTPLYYLSADAAGGTWCSPLLA